MILSQSLGFFLWIVVWLFGIWLFFWMLRKTVAPLLRGFFRLWK